MKFVSIFLLASVVACTGSIRAGDGENQSGSGEEGGRGAAGPGGQSGKNPVSGACKPLGARIWTLTPTQYGATVDALIPGAPAVAAALAETLPATAKGALVVNEAAALAMSTPHVVSMLDAADALANRAWAVRSTLQTCLSVMPLTRACVGTFIESFARRAFRRPVTTPERDQLVDFWAAETTAIGDEAAWKQMVAAVFLSPRFVYRTELGAPDAKGATVLTGYEKASFLSYLLRNGPPDDELMAGAASGALETRAGLAAQVRRLLAAETTSPGVVQFFEQNFQTDLLTGLSKDGKLFGQWSPALAADLQEETRRFTAHVLWKDDGRLVTLLGADYTLANARVAEFYGVSPPATSGFSRVNLGNTPRRGALMQAGVLAALSRDNNTAVVQRGMFIRKAILCQGMPPPPATVNAVPIPPDGQHTQKELFAVHNADPLCATCHALMDPVGLAFENFDPIGRYRDRDVGKPIDPSGYLSDVTHPGSFADPVALVSLLHKQPETSACFASRYYAFAVGHPEQDDADACVTEALAKTFGNDDGRVLPFIERMLAEPSFFERTR